MGYLPDDFDIKIAPQLMLKILKQIQFQNDLQVISTTIQPYNAKFKFSYIEQEFELDYDWEHNSIKVNRNICSKNLMVNGAYLIIDQENEYAKIAKFINETIHELYMIANGNKVMGVALKDDVFYLVQYLKYDNGILHHTPSLFIINNRKHQKQLQAMFKLTQATLLEVDPGWKWRSKSLAKITVNETKYRYLSFERLTAEIMDPNYMRHVPESRWYLDTFDFDQLISFVIMDLNTELSKLINYYTA